MYHGQYGFENKTKKYQMTLNLKINTRFCFISPKNTKKNGIRHIYTIKIEDFEIFIEKYNKNGGR
jgi:hypothetical protein